MKKRILNILNLLFVVLTVISGFIGIIWALVTSSINPPLIYYFTYQSNVFATLATLAYLIVSIIFIKKKIPSLFVYLRFSSMCSVSVTFLTVVFYLVRIYPAEELFGGPSFFMHALTPILSMVGFLVFSVSEKEKMHFKLVWTSALPASIYGTIYALFVFISKDTLFDVYCFASEVGSSVINVGKGIVSLVVMLIGAYVLGLIFFLINRFFYKVFNKQ